MRDCPRCRAPLEEPDVSRQPDGGLLEVLACRCGFDEPAPVAPVTRAWVRRRLAMVRAAMRDAQLLAEAEPVGHLDPAEVWA